jgi:hypothetical protein
MVLKIPRKTQTKGERYVWRFRCVGTFVNFEKMGWGFSSVPA